MNEQTPAAAATARNLTARARLMAGLIADGTITEPAGVHPLDAVFKGLAGKPPSKDFPPPGVPAPVISTDSPPQLTQTEREDPKFRLCLALRLIVKQGGKTADDKAFGLTEARKKALGVVEPAPLTPKQKGRVVAAPEYTVAWAALKDEKVGTSFTMVHPVDGQLYVFVKLDNGHITLLDIQNPDGSVIRG